MTPTAAVFISSFHLSSSAFTLPLSLSLSRVLFLGFFRVPPSLLQAFNRCWSLKLSLSLFVSRSSEGERGEVE
ncbi:hypothetical protein LguiA_021185 [Lonicera macranthoides]